MKLGFTGAQIGMNAYQKKEVTTFFTHYNPDELHHGDCIGSDSQCHYLFLNWHCENDTKSRKIVLHPGTNPHKRAFTNAYDKYSKVLKDKLRDCKYKIMIVELEALPYMVRNSEIVHCTDIMVATPKEMEHTLRSGTWSTIRRAWNAKKVIHVIPPL